MTRTLSIVGAGRVGRTLGKRLRERGWRIGTVVTRSARTSRAAVRVIGAGTPLAWGGSVRMHPHGKRRGSGRASARDLKAIYAADVIFLCTADDDLPALVRSLAKLGGAKCKGKIILHTSATLDRTALAPLARCGAATGSLHPMQAFGGTVIPKLSGVIFGVEGDPRARRMAQSIGKSLGGITVAIHTRDKPIYHAAAVIAAGSTYPTIEAGVQLLIRIGFTRERAMQTLVPLIRQIFDNIERIGPRAAWTGPLSRGDYAIVARHVRALRAYPREFRQSYAALSLLAGRLLAKNPADALKKIRRTLADG
ncbi:MAG TPA: Rossmann-like and DUF2520 domain-containing protein [Candidatus Acidoferrales bacterium]|nr:Rossmann-like and DUF2520 domain-containing protein [Candidatus Acidoferrales bacterium]